MFPVFITSPYNLSTSRRTMALSMLSSSLSFSPAVSVPRTVARAVAPQMAVEDMIGKYSVKDIVWDPLITSFPLLPNITYT